MHLSIKNCDTRILMVFFLNLILYLIASQSTDFEVIRSESVASLQVSTLTFNRHILLNKIYKYICSSFPSPFKD